MKDGHYFRDFVFVEAVASHVGVQRYKCRAKRGWFSALAAFQEPHAHYTVDVRGFVLDRVFDHGDSPRSAWVAARATPGGSSLARSTVATWCCLFRSLAPGHAGALVAHLAHLPLELRIGGDPAVFLRAARTAFRLHRSWPGELLWTWLEETLCRVAGRHLLSA